MIKNQIKLFLVLLILSISFIAVYYTWGRLAIGGDVLIPFNSAALEKYLYQWISIQNGQYMAINYFPLYLFYMFISFFKLSIYQISSILLFSLNLIAGFGVYKLIKLFYEKDDISLSIPIISYLLSPALLNGWHYMWIYSFIPWFLYLIFKIIKNKEIRISDLIWLNIILFFSSLDLPNPKYIFHLLLILGIILILSILLNLINLTFLFKNRWKILIFIVLSSYLYLPLLYFAINYSPKDYNVHVKAGYEDAGKMMDFGSATLDRMMRLHHNNLNLNTIEKEKYNSNPLITFLSFSFLFLIIINFLFRKNQDHNYPYQIIFLVLVLIYLLFASGPNPPFGLIYEYVVTNFSAFSFLRTTAGAVFFLSLFYSVLLFFFIRKIRRYQILVSTFLILNISIVSYPMINGEFYKNFIALNQYTNKKEYGFKIPNEYFDIKEKIERIKIDAKTLHPLSNLSYLNTRWGYFGFNIYNFLYDNYNIGDNAIYSNIPNHNIGFIFTDHSISGDKEEFKIKNKVEIDNINFLSLERVSKKDFLPHFYTPKKIIISRETRKAIPSMVSKDDYKIRSAIFLEEQNLNNKALLTVSQTSFLINNTPTLEFKKINPTKYRIRVHNASTSFPLVFSENFHDGWKAYIVRYKKEDINIGVLEKYKILDGNEGYQTTKEELMEYINKGWITSLGNGKEKTIEHNKWENNKEELEYIETYNIDFISKNFKGTIQNDNLPSGRLFETWFTKSIENKITHLKANGYANAWIIDPENICKESNCIKNPTGSYDFEIIIEFWPQRLFYIGSIITLLAAIFSSLLIK